MKVFVAALPNVYNLTTLSVTDSSFTVQWNVDVINDTILAQHYYYVVQVSRHGNESNFTKDIVHHETGKKTLLFPVKNLTFNTFYNVTVTSHRNQTDRNESGSFATNTTKTLCLRKQTDL
jgi:hypothetical protein